MFSCRGRFPPLAHECMSDANPYAAPRDLAAHESEALQWRLEGADLLVKNRAVLPAVDLETGVSDGELVTVLRQHQPLKGFLPGLLTFALVYGFGSSRGNDGSLTAYVLLAVFVIFFLRALFRGNISVWDQREAVKHRRRVLRGRFAAGLVCAAPLAFVAASIFGDPLALPVLEIMVACILLMLGGVVLSIVGRSRLRVGGGPQGWLKIRKLHPDAISYLRKHEEERQAVLEASGERKIWRVYTAFLHKYPLSILIDRKTGIWMAVMLVLLKVLRSKQMEQTMLAADGAVDVELGGLHAQLQDEVARWAAGHPEWKLLRATELDAPFSIIRQEACAFVDPALEHAVSFSCSWAKSKSDKVRCHSVFSTWLEDGTLLVTASCAVVKTGREGVEYQSAKGGAEAVFQAHLARCAGRAIRASASLQELRERLVEEGNAAARDMERLGWNSVVREMGR